MRRAIVALATTTGLLTGAAAAPAAEAPAPPPRVSPGITWGECPDDIPRGMRCGTLKVPLDHERPTGVTTTLGISLAQATGDGPKRGSILVNPGGPGGGGMWMGAFVRDSLPPHVREAYDVVAVDPRGNHHSDPIRCVDPAVFDKAPRPDPVPRTDAQRDRLVERARAYARGCADNAGRMLPHLGTLENARDLDLVRAALGEERISYIGWSYGTYLGAVYGELFPERVERMILDSVVDPRPDKIWYGVNMAQNTAFQERWRDFTVWAAREGYGDNPAAVEGVFERVLAGVRAKPAEGVAGPAEVYDMATAAMYDSSGWTAFADAIRAYDAGDPGPLARMYTPPDDTDANTDAIYTAVECHDGPWPRDWAVWERDARAAHAVSPLLTWTNTWMNAPCAFWPVPPREPLPIDGAGLPPVLLIQGTRDAATPPAGGRALHRALPTSRLLTVVDEGDHGILAFQPNPCVRDIAGAYLADGTLPPAGATCAADPLPTAAPPQPAGPKARAIPVATG